MLVAAPAAVASAVAVAAAGYGCGRNVMQTSHLRRRLRSAARAGATGASTLPLDDPPAAPPSRRLEGGIDADATTSSPSDRLRGMTRGELLDAFADGRAPTESELREWFSPPDDDDANGLREWDAVLLDNGPILSASSDFLTHQLFGGTFLPWRLLGEGRERKGRWNGKAFAAPAPAGSAAGTGINRFATKGGTDFCRHAFDYDVGESRVLKGGETALRLDYRRRQSPWSLWRSMRDELRVVELDDDDTVAVLLGMGWMGWSGGSRNCSPFLLEREVQRKPGVNEMTGELLRNGMLRKR